jgi:hypothetical protein
MIWGREVTRARVSDSRVRDHEAVVNASGELVHMVGVSDSEEGGHELAVRIFYSQDYMSKFIKTILCAPFKVLKY